MFKVHQPTVYDPADPHYDPFWIMPSPHANVCFGSKRTLLVLHRLGAARCNKLGRDLLPAVALASIILFWGWETRSR